MTLRIASLCAGVGGLDLAVSSVLDAELTWYAQYEPPGKDGKPDTRQYAAQVMAHRFPGVPNHGDITAIDYAGVEPVDILTAGFPCQDISLAGKRAGLMPGTRSGLWSHVARAVEVLRPPLVLLENVRSLTGARAHCDLEFCPRCMGEAGGGADAVPPLRALGAVLGDLADLGFDAQWQVLPASSVGAPHKRERIFVLARPAEGCSRGSRWASAEDAHREPREQRRLAAPGQTPGGRTRADSRGRSGTPAADTALDARPQGDAHRTTTAGGGGTAAPGTGSGALGPQCDGDPLGPETDDSRHRLDASGRFMGWGPYAAAIDRWEYVLGRSAPSPVDDRGRLAARFAEWMMGLPAGWVTDVPGIPRNAQLKCLGNGVVPQQGAAAFRMLLDAADAITGEDLERAA